MLSMNTGKAELKCTVWCAACDFLSNDGISVMNARTTLSNERTVIEIDTRTLCTCFSNHSVFWQIKISRLFMSYTLRMQMQLQLVKEKEKKERKK
jgi:hypothetical protein